MGTGKTSVGKVLARKLGLGLVDIDRRIEERTGRKIREIFGTEGEAAFRALEKEEIRSAVAERGVVITTGGGAVLDPENWEALRGAGPVVALTASAETVYRRVRHSNNRPLLAAGDKLAQIRALMEKRRPYYERAQIRMATDGRTPAQVAAMLVKELEGQL